MPDERKNGDRCDFSQGSGELAGFPDIEGYFHIDGVHYSRPSPLADKGKEVGVCSGGGKIKRYFGLII